MTAISLAQSPTTLPRLDGVRRLADMPRRAYVAQIMGLPVSVHVRGPRAHAPAVAQLVEAAFERLRSDDRLFSTYRPHSQVSRIRRGELRLADAHARVREVADLCVEAETRTGQAFSAWLPGPDGRRQFDPTGLVKGWSVESTLAGLRAELARLGPHDILISAGGDVVVSCERVDTPDWRIGIEDPLDRTSMLRTVALRRGAVATSGTAARGSHIIDPASGQPADQLVSATVIGPSLTWADVYATAAFVKGLDAPAWLSTLPEHAGLLCHADGSLDGVNPTSSRPRPA